MPTKMFSTWQVRVRALALSTALLLAFVFATPIQAGTLHQDSGSIYDDEFNGSNLNSRWDWLNGDDDAWRINRLQGRLIVDGTVGDMAVYCNNGKNILLQDIPEGPFEMTTKVDIEPTEDFQQAGLILMNVVDGQPDQDNYVKIDIAYSSFEGGKLAEFVAEENGDFGEELWWVLDVKETEPAFLKLTRNNRTISGYYSTDGEAWEQLGEGIFQLSPDAKMGLYSLAGVFAYGDQPTCTPEITDVRASFDYFRVLENESPAAIEDEEESDTEESDTDSDSTTEAAAEGSEEADSEEDATQAEANQEDATQADANQEDGSEEEGSFITRTLDDTGYASTCTYDQRIFVDDVRIGAINYFGAYDVWNDCDDGTSKGVIMLTPDNDAILYILMSSEVADANDVAAFEELLGQQLGQNVAFSAAEEGSEEGVEEDNDSALTIVDTPTPTPIPTDAPATSTPAFTPTSLPVATATPVPTATQARSVAVILAETLNLRGGPGTNYNRVGSVTRDTALTVTGQVNNCGWLQVTTPAGDTAWISGGSQFVNFTGNCASVPTVQPPAAPAQSQSSGSSSGSSAGGGSPNGSKGCLLFQNQLGPEITITFTNRDNNNNKTTKVPGDGEVLECYDPGRYTYTLDAPPPWGSTNGEAELNAGDYFTFPISGR